MNDLWKLIVAATRQRPRKPVNPQFVVAYRDALASLPERLKATGAPQELVESAKACVADKPTEPAR